MALFHECLCQILEGEKRSQPISGLLLRRTYPELERTHIRLFREKIPDKVAKYNENKHTAVFPKHSTLEFGYCESDSDIRNYMSAEYDFICIDEMTQFTEYQFKMLLTRLRTTKKEVFPNFFGASNPGDVGHAWVKRLFIDKRFTENEKLAGFTSDMFEFIPSKVFDNEFLMEHDPLYIINLRQLPEKQRLAMLDGNWDLFEGQYFTEFSREIHVVEPFDIPLEWERYLCADYGFSAPSAVYWLAVQPQDGNIFVYREIYESGLTAKQLCDKIKQLTPDSEKISRIVFDPACWAKSGQNDKSLADIFWQNQVFAVKGNNDRMAGANLMREYLKVFNGPTGKPTARIKFFNNCYELIRTLPELIHDKRKPEDCDTHGEDHCLISETLVLTEFGYKKISDIKPGEKVLTRKGLQKVVKANKTFENVKCYELETSIGKIIGTANHPIFLSDGSIKQLIDLEKEDRLVDIRVGVMIQLAIWKLQSSLRQSKSLTEDGITYVASIFNGKGLGSIRSFGNALMEKLQSVSMFITKTAIAPITNYPTLSYCPSTFTCLNILKNEPRKEWLTGKTTKSLPPSGMVQPQDISSTNGSAKNLGRTNNGFLRTVSFVAENIKLLSQAVLSFAMIIAKRLHFAQDVLVKKVKFHSISDVYNLTVKNCPEFICGQILVHNSYDAVRYGIMSTEYEVTPEKDYSHLEARIDPKTGYVDKKMEYIDA